MRLTGVHGRMACLYSYIQVNGTRRHAYIHMLNVCVCLLCVKVVKENDSLLDLYPVLSQWNMREKTIL